jgi:uncharacterized protein
MSDGLEETIDSLKEILDDPSIPKNVKSKIKQAIDALKEEGKSKEIRVNQALQDLDDVADDPNTPSLTRTQVWNVASSLESKT